MTTAEILSLVSLISYILAGIFLVLAVFFWFFFKIPVVIGGLSGRTARKSIERMRQANERSGNKSYRSSSTNVARGKLTDTMQQTAKQKKATAPPQQPKAVPGGHPETDLLTENKAYTPSAEETASLDGQEATTVLLDDNATTALNVEEAPVKRAGGKNLTMLQEVMLIHTDEVI